MSAAATEIPYDMEPHPLTRMYNGKFGIWLFLASEIMLFGALFSSYVLLRVGAPEGTWPIIGAPTVLGHEILNVPLAALNTVILITSSVTMLMSWYYLKLNNFGKGQLFLLLTVLLSCSFLVVKYFEYNSKLHHYLVEFDAPLVVDGEQVSYSRTYPTANGERTVHYLHGHITETVKDEDGYVEYYKFAADPRKPDHGHGHEGDAGHSDAHAGEHPEIELRPGDYRRMSNWGPAGSTFTGIYFTLTGLHGLHILGGVVVMVYFLLTGGSMWKKLPDKYANRIECTGLYWHFVDLVWIFLFPVLYLL